MPALLIRWFFVFLFFAVMLMSAEAFSQSRYTISGYVRDARTGETLIGASIKLEDNEHIGTSTNTYGFYSITLPAGSHELIFTHVGYQLQRKTILLEKDATVNADLNMGQVLEEVVVTQRSEKSNIVNPQMGVTKVTIQEIKRVPVILGEQDVLKTIQLLPGVISGGEGSSNFFVRGGSGDHNLILLDEAMVYNASHLFGFFSTFNSDAIKDVNLYKGGTPAQYGGRLASVLDIKMLDGNNKTFGVEGGLGLIASRLKVEGPIVKDKGSFMVSGRRTYADLFLGFSNDEDINSSRLYFYDLNIKANYRLDDKNTVFLSGYFGKDLLGYADNFDFDWGNSTATLRWNHLFNSSLFSNTTFVYSDFNYNVDISTDNFNFSIASAIRNFNFKQDLQLNINNRHVLRFGVDALRQRIIPIGITAAVDGPINNFHIDDRRGTEFAGYLSHEWNPIDRLNIIYGVRLNNFMLYGPTTVYTYDEEGDITGSSTYERGELIQYYFNPEPRFSLSYQLRSHNSIKASYNRNTQNLHQLSNSTSSLPTDAWVMSSNNIKPQIADQVAIGYYHNFNNDSYEFSLESYYKDMRNQIDYRNAADLQANEHVESELLYGIGRAYGLEFYLKKNRGRFSGWISYALSRSERQFDGINEGDWFAARQDRTHDFSTVAMYQLSPRWNFSATFVYSTGNAVTFPSGKYAIDDRTVWYYTERNGYRMPDYHRLDLGVTREGKPNRRFHSSWTFGVYNAYSRKNAYIIDFRESEANPNVTEIYRIALFGIIPSVTWNFKF